MRLRPFCSQLQDSPTMASGALAPFVRSLNDVDGLYEGAKFVAILGTASRIFTSAKDTAPSMASLLLLPLMAVGSLAVNYPTIPADLTTPVQQRLAVKGPSCKGISRVTVTLDTDIAS